MKGNNAPTAILRVKVPINDSKTLPRPFDHFGESTDAGQGRSLAKIYLYIPNNLHIYRIGGL